MSSHIVEDSKYTQIVGMASRKTHFFWLQISFEIFMQV